MGVLTKGIGQSRQSAVLSPAFSGGVARTPERIWRWRGKNPVKGRRKSAPASAFRTCNRKTSESNRFFERCLATHGHWLARYRIAGRSVRRILAASLGGSCFGPIRQPPTRLFSSGRGFGGDLDRIYKYRRRRDFFEVRRHPFAGRGAADGKIPLAGRNAGDASD